MGHKFPLDVFERMLPQYHLDRPIGTDEHEPRSIAAPGEIGNQIESRIIARMQILQHQQQRGFCSDYFQGLRHLAQHTLSGHTDRLSLQRFPFGSGNERRHLRKPGRCVLSKKIDDLRRRSAESSECIQYGEISLARAVMLQALAAGNQDFPGVHALLEESFDQRCLSDPGLACDKDDLAFTLNREVQAVTHFLQLGLSPKESKLSGCVRMDGHLTLWFFARTVS